MIFLDSRYNSSEAIFKAHDSRNNTYQLTVFRTWPSYTSSYFTYRWIETDRLDLLALKFLGKSSRWWEIMDLNPEVIDPVNIAPGTVLRIPNG